MKQDLSKLLFTIIKCTDYFSIHIELCDFTNSVKEIISQVVDKKPINNPIQGRCY